MKHVTENTDLRVPIYNGDTDPSINSFLTQNWTSSLNFPVEQEWSHGRLTASHMGGYVTVYGRLRFSDNPRQWSYGPRIQTESDPQLFKVLDRKGRLEKICEAVSKFVESKPFWKKYN